VPRKPESRSQFASRAALGVGACDAPRFSYLAERASDVPSELAVALGALGRELGCVGALNARDGAESKRGPEAGELEGAVLGCDAGALAGDALGPDDRPEACRCATACAGSARPVKTRTTVDERSNAFHVIDHLRRSGTSRRRAKTMPVSERETGPAMRRDVASLGLPRRHTLQRSTPSGSTIKIGPVRA
jgi:hypothetical protein